MKKQLKRAKQSKHITKLSKSPHRFYGSLFALLFAVVGVSIVALTHAATNGTLSLNASTTNPGIGDTITVTVVENSSTTPVNAVQADLTYDQTKLQFVSVDATGSPFEVPAQGTGGSGTVYIARGTVTPVTGAQTVATIRFIALAQGATSVSFAASSLLVTSGDHTNVLAGTTPASFTITDKTAPNAPSGLHTTGQTATSVALSWTAPTDNIGVTGYKIFSNGTQVGTTTGATATSFNVAHLAPSTSYSFTVKANDAAGNDSLASVALSQATTADTTAPSAPTALSATARTLTAITLGWTAPTDNVAVVGYDVYRDGVKVGSSTATSYADSGLTPGKSYSYGVVARDAAGNVSSPQTTLTAATVADTSAPTTPTNLTAPVKAGTSITLNWTKSDDNVAVTAYRVYRGGVLEGTSTTTSYQSTGLTINTPYTYTVQAVDAAGNASAQSASLSATIVVVFKPGDVDGNGIVNIFDITQVAKNFRKTGQTRADGDVDGNGVINIFDLSLVASNWTK